MVVQCPTCQSKFRIADDKVTDKGVRVRCTSCKNVFLVKKPGSEAEAKDPGSDVEAALDAAAPARPSARGAAPPLRAPPRPGGLGPAIAARPAPPSRPPTPAARGGNGARKLDADDLFGMAELTGDAPPGGGTQPPQSTRSAPSPRSSPPPKPMPNFDDIDIDVEEESSPPPPRTAPAASRPPPPPKGAARPPPPPPSFEDHDNLELEGDPRLPTSLDSGPQKAVSRGPLKTAIRDPFEGINLGEHHPGDGLQPTLPPKKADAPRETRPEAPAPAPATASAADSVAPPSPSRDFVSSALTGLVGAALAVAVLLGAALNADGRNLWLGIFRGGNDLVATRVVSGLYDTVAGKPVFYVRGRVENRGQKLRGPVRVVAELVNESGAEARAEAIAGAEPTAEDVWSLRSKEETDKLVRSLEMRDVQRGVPPGQSLPFFAVIPEPPADLQGSRLRVRVEPVEASAPPPAPKAAPKR